MLSDVQRDYPQTGMIHCVSHSTCHWPAHKWMGDIVQYCPYLGEQPPLHLYRVRAHPHNIIGLASVYGVCQHLRHSACCPSMKVWVWHWPQQKILIVVWQMLTDLSRVRKYRRLKPFLFITVVIMVNVYSTLNFRGPPPLFFSLVSDQPVCCFDQAEAQLAPLVQIPMVSFSSIQSSWGANLSDSLYESSLYA